LAKPTTTITIHARRALPLITVGQPLKIKVPNNFQLHEIQQMRCSSWINYFFNNT